MLSNFFDLIGTSSFWFILALIVGLVVAVVFCLKYPKIGGPMLLCLFGLALIGADIYCVTQLNIYYNAEGGIHGFLTGIFDTNKIQIVDDFTFKVEDIELTEKTEGTYSASITTDRVISVNTRENLGVFVNGAPCDTTTEVDKDYVIADYTYTFFDTDKSVILTDTLTINIAFYGNSTTLTLSTKGGTLPVEDCIKYWHSYFNKNGFEVKVAPFGDITESPDYSNGDTANYKVLSYFVNNELHSSVCVNTGETVAVKSLESETFLGWYTADDKLIVGSIVVNDNVNLYAKIADENTPVYTVTFDNRGATNTVNFYEGQKFKTPEVYAPEGYAFKGWTTSKDTTITINPNTYSVTEDKTLYALYSKKQNLNKWIDVSVEDLQNSYTVDLDDYIEYGSLFDYVRFNCNFYFADYTLEESVTVPGNLQSSGNSSVAYGTFDTSYFFDVSTRLDFEIDTDNVITLNPYKNYTSRADATVYKFVISSVEVWIF